MTGQNLHGGELSEVQPSPARRESRLRRPIRRPELGGSRERRPPSCLSGAQAGASHAGSWTRLDLRKEGLQVSYSIADPSAYQLCDLTCGSIGKQLGWHAGAFGAGAS